MNNWIWFAKRNVPFYQNDTEPKLFPNEYEKYVPKSEYDKKSEDALEILRCSQANLENFKMVLQKVPNIFPSLDEHPFLKIVDYQMNEAIKKLEVL